jgi:hypothetical protein
MERCLLVPLILFPFAVMGFVAFPLFPGTTTLFFGALLAYGFSLRGSSNQALR